MSHNKAISIILIIAFVTVFFSLGPTNTLAQSQESVRGVDVVFLIDQSGSMEDSDPLGLRFEGLQFAMDWMGRTILEYDQDHVRSFRTAVIDFGSDTSIVLDAVEIVPKSEDMWASERLFFSERLSSDNRPTLGGTDFKAAFEAAKLQFLSLESDQQEERSKVIILLTDGMPYPSSEDALQELKVYIQENFPYPEYSIHVIGLSSPASSPWSVYLADWKTISHNQVHLVENRRVLGSSFQDVLGEIGSGLGIEGDMELECGMIPVPPFLDFVRFTIHKPVPAETVMLFDSADQLINGQQTNVSSETELEGIEIRGQDTPIESITVFNPRPGMWRAECPTNDDSRPIIYARNVSAGYQMEVLPGKLALGVPYEIRMQFEDHWGKPLGEYSDPRFTLDPVISLVSISDSDAKIEEIHLQFDANQNAYLAEFVPTTLGEWQPNLVVRTANADGRAHVVVAEDRPPFRTINIHSQVDFEPDTPQQFSPIGVRLVLVDDEGKPFIRTTAELANITAQAIFIENSHPITTTLTELESGSFEGEFIPYKGGNYDVSAQLLLSNQSSESSTMIAHDRLESLQVNAAEMKATIEPAELSKGITATLNLKGISALGNTLALPIEENLAVEIRGLGEDLIEVANLSVAESEISGTFVPSVTGVFTPELTLLLKRTGGENIFVAYQLPLGTMNVAEPTPASNGPGEINPEDTILGFPRQYILGGLLIAFLLLIALFVYFYIVRTPSVPNPNARGYVSLEQPLRYSVDFVNSQKWRDGLFVWRPKSEYRLKSGRMTKSRLDSIAISQSEEDSSGSNPGVRVTVVTDGGFQLHNEKWLDEENPLSLPEGFQIAFRRRNPKSKKPNQPSPDDNSPPGTQPSPHPTQDVSRVYSPRVSRPRPETEDYERDMRIPPVD